MRTISSLLSLRGLQVLPIPASAVEGWMELLQRHPVTGAGIFDLQIIAATQKGQQSSGRIYTATACR